MDQRQKLIQQFVSQARASQPQARRVSAKRARGKSQAPSYPPSYNAPASTPMQRKSTDRRYF